MTIRTVTVDFWGTLMVDSPASDERYRGHRMAGFERILHAAGRPFSSQQLTRAYEGSGDYLRGVWSTGRDVPVTEHVTAILRGLDRRLATDADPVLLAALVDAYALPVLLVPPAADRHALASLKELREMGITLVIVSNIMRTPGTTLRTLLEQLELLDCFAHTVFSDEAGIRKPDPAIFVAAMQAVGGRPETTVHVGDDPILDVLGARAAGLRVIQVATRGAGDPPTAEAPDATIYGLDELPEAILALDRQRA